MYYFQSRYYDPAIGRFINADAYISTGTGTLGNNMFAYCNNSPISHKDTTGDVVDVVFDVASLYFSIVNVTANPYDPTAWFGLIGDVVDVVVPCVSGVGESAKAIGALHKAADIADDIHDTGRSVQRGWKVGDNISNLTGAGTVPTWNTVKSRYWKNAEHYKVDSPLYSTGDITYKGTQVNNTARMKKGYAPIGYDGYPVNLHHTAGKANDLFNVVQMSQTAHQAFHKAYGYKGFVNIRTYLSKLKESNMKYIYDFVAGKVPFEEFWPEFCRNKEMQEWLDTAGNFEAEEPIGIMVDRLLWYIYRGIREDYDGHILKYLELDMEDQKTHYYPEEKYNIFLGFAAAVFTIDPKVVRTKIYKQDYDFYRKAVGCSMDGPEVWNFIDSVLEQFPRTMKAADRVKAGRAALHEAFHIQGRKFPSWPQEAEWPMGKNSPMEYLGRHKDGDLVQLRFRDVDTGEERVIKQFY